MCDDANVLIEELKWIEEMYSDAKVMLKGHGECKLVRDAFSDVHERVASQMARRWRQKYKSIEEMAISRRHLS
jgi:hypothetical protein